jgi:hypothetical protein
MWSEEKPVMERILGTLAVGLLALGLLLPTADSPLSSLMGGQDSQEQAGNKRLVELGPVELVAVA